MARLSGAILSVDMGLNTGYREDSRCGPSDF